VVFHRIPLSIAGLVLGLGGAIVQAGPPAPIDSRDANRPEHAPRYQPQAPAGSAERAADALNERDRREIERRRRDGDDDPETRDGVRIRSSPDHPGENDGKP
jgi:hypothetical protein